MGIKTLFSGTLEEVAGFVRSDLRKTEERKKQKAQANQSHKVDSITTDMTEIENAMVQEMEGMSEETLSTLDCMFGGSKMEAKKNLRTNAEFTSDVMGDLAPKQDD